MRERTPYTVRARNLAPDSDNKIHDDEVARRFGFTGALVPGVEVFAYATQPFAAEWGEDFLRQGVIDVRFRRPVYDGEDVAVAATPGDAGYVVTLAGPDGEVRALGTARLAKAPHAPDVSRYVDTPRADPPPRADETSLAVGRHFGTVHEPVTPEGHAAYLEGVSDTLPLYKQWVHPGEILVHPRTGFHDMPLTPSSARVHSILVVAISPFYRRRHFRPSNRSNTGGTSATLNPPGPGLPLYATLPAAKSHRSIQLNPGSQPLTTTASSLPSGENFRAGTR